MKHITHLVFCGNALKSISLCGILRYLYFYKLDSHIHDVSATSMGAFFALAFALKIPIEKLEEIILDLSKDTSVTKFIPSSFINIINNYGLCCSIDYLKGLRKYIFELYNQDDITFLELSKKTGVNIYVSTTRVDTGTNVIFNVNDTPNVSVLSAIGASMCIPFVSQPIIIDGYYYVDGYLTNNFPYEVFNNINKDNILVVASDVNKYYEMKEMKKGSELSIIEYYFNIAFIYYINNFKLCYIDKLNNFNSDILFIYDNDMKCLCTYDNINNCIDFSLSEEELNILYLIGYKSIHDYMNKYNSNIIDISKLNINSNLINSNFNINSNFIDINTFNINPINSNINSNFIDINTFNINPINSNINSNFIDINTFIINDYNI
jgi:predicted acylesterase/phospholipase RssA